MIRSDMSIEPDLGPARLLDSATMLSEMLTDSTLGYGILDEQFRYLEVNQTLADIHNFPIAAHINQPMVEIIGDELFNTILPSLRNVLDKGEQAELSLSAPRLGREGISHTALYLHPVRNAAERITGICILAVDVTQGRLAEEDHNRVDSQLQLALEAAGMGLWRWGLSDTSSLQWSPTAAQLLGIDASVTPSKAALTEVIDSATIEKLKGAIRTALGDGTQYEEEVRVVWPDHSVHWLMVRGEVRKDLDGNAEMVGVLADITERHAQEVESTRNAMRQARAGEQAVRMQRVTAALSQAATVSQVGEVLLTEGAAVLGSPRGIITLLNESADAIESMQYEGYGEDWNLGSNQTLEDPLPIPECIRTGQPVLLSNPKEMEERFPAASYITDESGTKATAALPLSTHGRIFGSWCLSWTEPRVFEEGELIILLTLAAQGAQAIERAQLYERERVIANALQRTLLPRGLPTVNGLTTATRYRPGTAGVQIGGDWYDVIRLSSNRVGLVIGDVGGHNIDAAAVMGQLRNAVRSYAYENHPAGQIMELTNQLLCGLEPGVFATCCYVELNLDDGIATLSTAGHPPPLVIDSERGVYFVQLPPGTPLGTRADQEFKQSTLFLSPGNSLVLYTDGLVESRTMGVVQGMQRIASAAAEHQGAEPEKLADFIMQSTATELEDDDLAMLIVNYAPTSERPTSDAGPRAIHRYLPSSAASAGVARRFAADVMADWGAVDMIDQVELCVSELVTNALIHTAADVELILRLSPSSVRVEVIDHSDRMPILRKGGDEDTSGRGLYIVDAIASAWGVEPAASGKSVWFQIQRSNAGPIEEP